MKKLVILTGAGMSAESGVKTFRDNDGLWENHRVEDVASIEAWHRNPELVMEFYNQRRKQLHEVEPNQGHFNLAQLEKYFDVEIITQNVDDLHERAGSTKVLHLHGELKKVRSTKNPDDVFELNGWELKIGDLADDGSQLRPHIVWFGEDVPMIYEAMKIVEEAEIFVIIGTSLQVYPAAGLTNYTPSYCPKYYIDPKAGELGIRGIIPISKGAVDGTLELLKLLANL